MNWLQIQLSAVDIATSVTGFAGIFLVQSTLLIGIGLIVERILGGSYFTRPQTPRNLRHFRRQKFLFHVQPGDAGMLTKNWFGGGEMPTFASSTGLPMDCWTFSLAMNRANRLFLKTLFRRQKSMP